MITRKGIIGLSIEDDVTILVHIQRKAGNKFIINEVKQFITPPGAIFDGDIVHKTELIKDLTQIVMLSKLTGVPTVIAISPRQAIIRSVNLPQMPKNDILKSLEWEASRYITLSNTSFTMDYNKLSEKEIDGTTYLELLMIAAKNGVLQKFSSLVKKSGLKIKSIDLEVMAYLYLRKFAYLNNVWSELEKAWTSVAIGNSCTSVSFFQRDVLQFVHTIPIKKNNIINNEEEIIRELQRSLNYYHNQIKKEKTQAIYIWGKDAEKILSRLQGKLEFPIYNLKLSLLNNVFETSESLLKDEIAYALGLSLREVVS